MEIFNQIAEDIFGPGWRERKQAEREFYATSTPGGRRTARMNAVRREPINRLSFLARDRGICHICSEEVNPLDYHLDHVVPLAKGGSHTYDNLKIAHPVCNLRKGAKLL